MPDAARSVGARRWVPEALLVAALVVTGLRPLIQETHDTFEPPLARAITGTFSTGDALGPATTVAMDLIILALCGATWALRRAGWLLRPRETGLTAGLVLVAVAGAAACLWSGNQRLAVTTTLDAVATPLLGITLAHLLQRRWHMHLALSVIVASGAAVAAQCYEQSFITLPDTVASYHATRDALWAQQGLALDDYAVVLFERRLHEQAATGGFAFSNIAGSYLVLIGFAVVGLCTPHTPRRGLLVRGLLAAGVFGAVLLTHSRGAIAASALGAGLMVVWFLARRRIVVNRLGAWRWGWAVALAVLGGVAAWGLTTGGLPGGSLTYRWWYLEGTARLLAHHPLGVGGGQFGRFYPRYKEIKSPEEIATPHNFLAESAAAWGWPGLVAVVLMLVGGSRVLSGLTSPAIAMPSIAPRPPPAPARRTLLRSGVGIATLIFVGRVGVIPYENAALAVWLNLFPLIGWLIGFGVAAAWSFGSSGPLRAALGAGLLAFLVHNLITFATTIPASATTFWALFGVAAAATCQARMRVDAAHQPPEARGAAARPVAMVLAATLAVVVLGAGVALWPVMRSRAHLRTARTAHDWPTASARYAAAVAADPRDPAAAREWLEVSTAMGSPEARAAAALRAADPESPVTYRLLARAALDTDPVRAAALQEETLLRYPTQPEDHVRMADIQQRLLGGPDPAAARTRLILALQTALDLDDARDPEEVRRFSKPRRAQLQAWLDAALDAAP